MTEQNREHPPYPLPPPSSPAPSPAPFPLHPPPRGLTASHLDRKKNVWSGMGPRFHMDGPNLRPYPAFPTQSGI